MHDLVLVLTFLCLALTAAWLVRLSIVLIKLLAYGIDPKEQDNLSFYLGAFVLSTWGAGAIMLYYYHVNDPQKMGTLGDTMGILNSLFSALAFAGVLYSIRQQNKVIKAQRKDFNEQMNTQYLDRFESTFFRLLDIHRTTKDRISTIIHLNQHVRITGDDAISEFHTQFKLNLNNDSGWKDIQDELFKMLDNNLDFYTYMDNLHAMHLFILTHKNLTFDQKDFYLKIITRAASYEELAFYFYYFSIVRGDVYAHDGLDIFNQLDPKYLLNEAHISYYYGPTSSH